MAFTLPREPSHQESLQCLALAGLQQLGHLTPSELKELMLKTHPQSAKVWKQVGIDTEKIKGLYDWADDPAKPALLDEWLNSSIWVANSLYLGGKYLSGGTYTFYRQDQFPFNKKGFKTLFAYLRDQIKKDGKKDPRWLETTAGKIYSEIEINEDKWNPADIVAVKDNANRTWKTLLSKDGFLKWVAKQKTGSKSSLRKDMKEFAKMRGKPANSAINKLKIVDAMSNLYDYNKLIYRGMKAKTFVPISLKKADHQNPQVQAIFVKEPKDLQKYFNMRIKVDKVEMLPGNKKAKVYFKLTGLGPEQEMYFDMRGFESTAAIADIQIQLMQTSGGSAAHGKITLPVTTQQLNLSGGKQALAKMKRRRNAIFRDLFKSRTKAAKNRRAKMASDIHGFTDYRIFQQLQRDVHDKFKNPKDNTLTEEIAEVRMWGNYVHFLSAGKTKRSEFITNATGNKFYTDSAKEKLNFEIDKNGNVIVGKLTKDKKSGAIVGGGLGPKRMGLDMSHTQVKYMKDKVQSYEMAWVLTNSYAAKESIQENVMKSMYMYAASKGFALFRTPTATFFMLHGPYLKCAA